jgi:phosphate transport system protein
VLKELLGIFRADSPRQAITDNFVTMLNLSKEMILEASAVFWGKQQDPAGRKALFDKDVQVNQYERTIRKQLVTHLAVGDSRNVPFGLAMMSLVKDVERLGDYAKNLAELVDLRTSPIPDGGAIADLADIRRGVEALASEASDVFTRGDKQRATELTRSGRSVTKRCEDIVRKVAASTLPAEHAVTIALAARFYKRIQKHLLNLLSAVIMPLHKLDYFDEDALNSWDRER